MTYAVLIRKVTRPKWDKTTGLVAGEIPADAFADLRTSNNTLSMWIADASSPSTIEDAVLCLATSGERLDTVQIAIVDEKAIRSIGPIVSTPGLTPVNTLAGLHRDLEGLDHVRLGSFAVHVKKAIDDPNRFKLFTKAEVKGIICKAINQGLVSVSSLKEKVQEEIRKEIEKTSRH